MKKELHFAFEWDWKEQPNFNKIFQAVKDIVDSGLTPFHYEIKTDGDSNGLLVCPNSGYDENQTIEIWHEMQA